MAGRRGCGGGAWLRPPEEDEAVEGGAGGARGAAAGSGCSAPAAASAGGCAKGAPELASAGLRGSFLGQAEGPHREAFNDELEAGVESCPGPRAGVLIEKYSGKRGDARGSAGAEGGAAAPGCFLPYAASSPMIWANSCSTASILSRAWMRCRVTSSTVSSTRKSECAEGRASLPPLPLLLLLLHRSPHRRQKAASAWSTLPHFKQRALWPKFCSC